MTSGAIAPGLLTIGCFNSRSICNKTSGVVELLKDNGISLCMVTETWLKMNDRATFAEIHDLGYDIFSAPRQGRGGGVAFLFDPKTISPVRNSTRKFSSFEVLECVLTSGAKLIRLCVVYRSTQAKTKYNETKVTTFLQQFDDYLESLCDKSGAPIICGDFNFHVEDASNAHALKFIDVYESKGFTQMVTGPTHISGGTLDLVMTLKDSVDSIAISGLEIEPNTGTESDHHLIKFQIPFTSSRSEDEKEEKEVRELHNIDVDAFREDVFSSPLNLSDFSQLGLDDSVDLLHEVLQDLLDKHAPLVTKHFRSGRSPFWDAKCQEAVRERRKAKRKMKKNQEDNALKAIFHEKSVDAQIIIDNARNKFYSIKLQGLKGDSRGTYKVVNQLLDKQYGSDKKPNGEVAEVAEKLKNFFDTKVKKIYTAIEETSVSLASNVEQSQDPLSTSKVGCALTSFNAISIDTLEKLITDLPNKSSPLDVIPLWLFKNCLPEILPFIHHIVNLSLNTGMFPSSLKEASVRPALKKTNMDVDELKNYRPISNLTYISKLLEKVVHHQLNEYLSSNNLFCDLQSGYRKNHSCETAVTRIHNDLLMMIDKRENVILLLLDLSAAFDTINHGMLLRKLRDSFGLQGMSLKWLKSYLSGRTFSVRVNSATSSSCILEIGVPQGSILGPLLFILYTKDLEKIVSKYGFSIHLYADDTQVYFSFDVNNANPDLSALKRCFQDIKQWMADNYLKLNEDKTEAMDIGYYVSTVESIDLGDSSIKPIAKAKNLGFLFDHRLNLSDQVSTVSQACYLNQRNLSKIGSKLTHELKIQLVHSNILCFLDYCNAAYCGLHSNDLKRLQRIQNNAVRFIFGLYGTRKKQSIAPYLKQLHFLPVRFRITFKVALLVFKCLNNMAPTYLNNLISLRKCHQQSSRLDDDFFLLEVPPKPILSRTEAAFTYSAPRIWNSLPYNIRSSSELSAFKSELKTYLFREAFDDV